jgi:putative nucleotidyltransferase with HDIG domain
MTKRQGKKPDEVLRMGIALLFAFFLVLSSSTYSNQAALLSTIFAIVVWLQSVNLNRWHFLHLPFLFSAAAVDWRLSVGFFIAYSLFTPLFSRRGVLGSITVLLTDAIVLFTSVLAFKLVAPEIWTLIIGIMVFVRSALSSLIARLSGWSLEIGAMAGYPTILGSAIAASGINLCLYFERNEFSSAFLTQIALVSLVSFAVLLIMKTADQKLKSGILSLCNLLFYAHPYTGDHSRRVGTLARETARRIGIPEWKLDQVVYAALLHDIGKIAVDERILEKPGKLTDAEFSEIKKHPSYGEQILSQISDLNEASKWVRHHHEKLDGNGYPDRITRVDIPIESKLISVIDAFDAMTDNQADGHKRLYREPVSVEHALDELKRCSGSQFDAEIVRQFIQVVREVETREANRIPHSKGALL